MLQARTLAANIQLCHTQILVNEAVTAETAQGQTYITLGSDTLIGTYKYQYQ